MEVTVPEFVRPELLKGRGLNRLDLDLHRFGLRLRQRIIALVDDVSQGASGCLLNGGRGDLIHYPNRL